MSKVVDTDQLAEELTQALKDYTSDVSKAINKETKKTTDNVLKEVKAKAPKDRPEYYKYFTKTKKTLSDGVSYTVWNKKYYNLIHLLEFGHAKVGGGRVRAFPHMRTAAEKNIAAYERRIKQIIKNGGG